MTELHEAASLGDLVGVEDALKKGLNPNEPDPDWGNRTPLHIAASNGSFSPGREVRLQKARMKQEVLKLLLTEKAGADCNVTTTSGWTPAHFACETGQLQCLQALISAGCDLTITDTSGDSPLSVAEVQLTKVKRKGRQAGGMHSEIAVAVGNVVGSVIPYQCPYCKEWSRVSSYGGNIVQGAKCPRCHRDIFKPDK